MMPGETINADAKLLLDRIESAEKLITLRAASLSKLKTKLSKAKSVLLTQSSGSDEFEKLILELRAVQGEVPGNDLVQLANSLGTHVNEMRRFIAEKLPGQIRDECETAKLPFKKMTDAYGVGPFRLTIQPQKEKASLEYADSQVVSDIPLNAKAIVHTVMELKRALLDIKVDPSLFANHFEEAIRVVAARQKKAVVGTVRAELPKVHQELTFIRQMASKNDKATSANYSRVRFIIELRQFMDSNQFLEGEHEFRLETAVIENAKNPKKSIQIPNDVTCGYGEGKSYQAVTMRL